MNTRALVPEDLARDGDLEGRAWGRTLAACVIANRDCVDPEPVLKATWPDDRHAAARLKAATSPTSTGNAPALLLDVVQAFRSLAPASAAFQLFEKGLQVSLDGINSITLPSLANVPPVDVFVAEGMPAPNLQFDFGSGTVVGPTRKILLLAAASGELESAAPGTMSAVLGKILSDAASRGLDAAAFGTQAADDTVPQGLLHSVTPVTAAAAGPDSMVQDIGALLDAIAVNNMDTSAAVFVADAGTVGVLKTKVGPRFDYGLLSTLALPPKTVVCVAPAAIASAYADPPQIEVSKVPAVHFEGSDPLPIASPGSPPTVAAPVYSHFQAARVGIATGLVVVGDLIGSGASKEQAIVGETPNLAARLQGIAEPNAVVVAESTRKLLGDLFELEDLGAKDLKGVKGHVRAWAALRPGSIESRFEALHAGALTELIGREEELDLLLRRWSKAKTGQGQVVLLSGEAGIGKSRLTASLLERLATEPHTRLRYFCSPQHTDSALYPIISQMERAAGFTHADTAQVKLGKLGAVLALAATSKQDAALFTEMLSLANDGRYPTLERDPQQRRQKTLEALTAQLQALAHAKPVLMIFEDAHWLDPTSLEVLGRTVDRVKTLGVLLIITYRPEFEPPWIGRPYVTALTLNRLGEHEIAAMVVRVAGNKPLPESVRRDIIARTDGIPLFVEEMTKAVLEAAAEGAAEHTIAAIPQSSIAVPASLHASLMARLDRLGPVKEMAQIGAAIGREFSHALLAAVVRKSDHQLGSALDRLIQSGLLFRQGVPPHATYLFKHALVQDAAYSTLLREPRRALHARIAETIESSFSDIAENQPELLARHCTEAGLIEKAVGLWGKAGQRSMERSALLEAVEQFKRALDQIATLPSTPALRRMQINLQVALITPLNYVNGWAAPETKAAIDRARLLLEQADTLGEPLEDPLLLFSVLIGAWSANFVAFNGDVSHDLAAQMLALAEKQKASFRHRRDQQGCAMVAHNFLGAALLLRGEIEEARTHFDQAAETRRERGPRMAHYDPGEHRPLPTRFREDPGVAILFFRSKALWLLGYPDAALTDIDQALKYARASGFAVSLLWALMASFFFVDSYCGNYTTVNARLDEHIALADEKDAPLFRATGMVGRGWLLGLTGSAADAVETITSGIAAYRSTGATKDLPSWLSYLAAAHAELGQLDAAWRCVGEAMAAVETTKERWFEAEIHRTAGEIALKSLEPDAAKAEGYFERALTIARSQQAKSWELRAAMSLARLWRDQGKVQQARELLAPVYGWFTEGFDTRDLKEAKALLDELRA